MKIEARWKICFFLFFATVLNYMDRQTLSITAPVIQKEFHFDNAQLGLLFSSFYITYAISVALLGELVDRISIRLTFALAVLWWSAATAFTGLAHTFAQLFVFRLLLGIGEAANWPATARIVSMYIPPKQRTLANSLYMGGGSLGLILVQPLLVWLSLSFGWRAGFAVIGALSSIWLAAWLLWFRARNISSLPRFDESKGAPDAWSQIVRQSRFWGLMIASLCGNTCLYFLMNWLPTFLVQDRKFTYDVKLGGVVIIPFIGLDLGYLLSGFVVLRLTGLGHTVARARRMVVIGAACLMSISVIVTPFTPSDALLVFLLFGTTVGMAAWNANYLCEVEELSPNKVSAVAGVIGSLGAFGGAISAWLVGVASKTFGNFTLVFVAIGLMIWVGSFAMLFTSYRARIGRDVLSERAIA